MLETRYISGSLKDKQITGLTINDIAFGEVLDGTIFNRCTFIEPKILKGTVNVTFKDCKFEKIISSNAIFKSTTFENCVFINPWLPETRFENCKFKEVKMSDIAVPYGTKLVFSKSDLKDLIFNILTGEEDIIFE